MCTCKTMTELKLWCSWRGRAPTGRCRNTDSRVWVSRRRRHKSLALLRTKRVCRQLQHPLSLLSNFIDIVSHSQPGMILNQWFKHINTHQKSNDLKQGDREERAFNHRVDIKLWTNRVLHLIRAMLPSGAPQKVSAFCASRVRRIPYHQLH